jgi:hypothetical protein
VPLSAQGLAQRLWAPMWVPVLVRGRGPVWVPGSVRGRGPVWVPGSVRGRGPVWVPGSAQGLAKGLVPGSAQGLAKGLAKGLGLMLVVVLIDTPSLKIFQLSEAGSRIRRRLVKPLIIIINTIINWDQPFPRRSKYIF